MQLVKEHIDFKRGVNPYNKLKLGWTEETFKERAEELVSEILGMNEKFGVETDPNVLYEMPKLETLILWDNCEHTIYFCPEGSNQDEPPFSRPCWAISSTNACDGKAKNMYVIGEFTDGELFEETLLKFKKLKKRVGAY